MSTDQVQTVETEVQIQTQESEGGTVQGKETREQRDQMKALSLEIFGKSSRYQKMFQYDEVLTRKVKETVPGENGAPDTEREVEVPVMVGPGKGSKQSRRKYRTVEQVIQVLVEFKAKRDEFIAQMKKQQEEAAAKKEADLQAQKLQQELGGSALT